MVKDIKLIAKKGGNGYISSYTINLSLNEARDCGFIDDTGAALPVQKVINPESREIIIRLKLV